MKPARPLSLAGAALAAALAIVSLPAGAQAQWKWRGADGKVQYSDRPPPPEVAEKNILGRPAGARRYEGADPAPATPDAAGAPAVKASDPQLEARRREAEQAEKAKQKVEEERVARQKAENCNRARSYAKTLEDGMRITRTNDKGENEVLNEGQRAQELARAQQVMAADCK
jgi:hypothetical protein